MALKPARLQWPDGKETGGRLRSLDYDDIYFQPQEGREESHYVFLEQNRLPERFAAGGRAEFRIAELGFGSGLNFLLTAKLLQETQGPRLFYTSIEKHPIPRDDLEKIFSFWPDLRPYTKELLRQYPPLVGGFHHLHFLKERLHLMLLFGDVADILPQLEGRFDAWYLDGFAPAKNPAMWEGEVLRQIAARTAAGGTLSSFSSAGAVRRGLQAAGFEVKKTKGFGTKRDMTVARMPASSNTAPQRVKTIAVLGAGIAGASAAFALAQKGYDVTVIDRGPVAASETSGNPVAIVYPKLTVDPSPMGLFHQSAFCFTRSLVTALGLASWNACGVTHLDTSEEDKQRHRKLSAAGHPEDFLLHDPERGLMQPSAGYLSPAEFCQALLDHPRIKTVFSTEVSALEDLGHDAVVIALGYGSKNFRETTWLPLQSVRGQISFLRPTPQSEKIGTVFCHDGYITPVIDGLHYAGATFQKEEAGALHLRAEDHAENLQKLQLHLPGLGFTADHIAGGRAGFRATTPDRLPLAGACPDHGSFIDVFSGLRNGGEKNSAGKYIRNLYLMAGFGSHGFTTAPLAGEIIACLISGDPLPVPADLMPYLAPERFILRDLKRRKI